MKACKNCGHRNKNICNLRGLYVTVERQHYFDDNACGIDFKRWIPYENQ